jgi:hypothetical protein
VDIPSFRHINSSPSILFYRTCGENGYDAPLIHTVAPAATARAEAQS